VTSIAYTEGDPVALAKALFKYAKGQPEFSFKAVWSKARNLRERD
jgi:ribosomal protein L10